MEMRDRVVGALALGPLILIAVAFAPSAHASDLNAEASARYAAAARDGGTLLLRDGEALFVSASSEAGRAARRQPQPVPEKPARILERRQRPNTISVGIQGQYGGIRGNSRLADGFDNGPGYAFRFRYMVSPSSAVGFSFEHQRFGSINPPINVQGDFADSHVVATTVAIEGVFYVHRERMAMPYFVGGFGYASPDIIFSEDQSSRVNEGAFAVLGAGFERFIRPRFSADVSIRGYAMVSNSQFTSMGQLSLGIHLYPGD
jgi:hypothetical protein